MKLFAVLLNLFLFLFPLSAQADTSHTDWTGAWDTSQNTMILKQSGSTVKGDYNLKNGEISAQVLPDNTLKGYWGQKTSNEQCTEMKLNTFYWGKMYLKQKNEGEEFTGEWGYCNKKPDTNWTGKRIKEKI